jgi:hypothetical protein
MNFEENDFVEFPTESSSSSGRFENKTVEQPANFPYDEPEDNSLGGKVYMWVKKRYHKNGRPWKKSDVIVWKAWCYVIPIWIGYLLFGALFGWLFIKTYDKWGIGKLASLVGVLILWRLNVAIKTLGEINKKLGGLK